MADENEQSDEIMALQSIYDDETFSCNISDRLITGKITIFLDSDSEGHNFMCSGDPITIKHVPPLILDFSLPPNYPSESPPDVTLSCSWLTSEQLKTLSEKLNEKWIESCNGVVLFTWFDFLKTEAIKALDLKFPIVVSVEQILKLTEESILRGEEIFSRGCHYCPVCLLVKPGNECICLSTCEHILCKDCLSEYLTISIQEGNIHAIRCPCEECDEEIYPNIIKSLVCQKDFERYDRLLLKNVLEVMPDIMCCPRIPCQKPVLVDKKDQMGFCNFCTFAFCTRCKLTYHGVEVCNWQRDFIKRKNEAKEKRPHESSISLAKPEKAKKGKKESRGYTKQMDYWGIPEDERVRLAAEYIGGDEEIREGLEEYYGTERMKDMVLDLRSNSWKWIKANTKKCPKCSVQIERFAGCNHMRCSKCRTHFCWACLMEFGGKNPYRHYSNRDSPCYNRLAEVDEDEVEEVAEEHLDVYNEPSTSLF